MAASQGFEDFVSARGQALQRFAYLLTSDWALAEDLVHTAFSRAYPRWSRIQVDEPEAYVRKIMVNTWSSWWRRRWRGEVPAISLPEVAARDPYQDVDRRHAIRSALAGLPHRQRLMPGSKQSQVPQLAAPARIHRPRGFLATTEFTGQGSTFVVRSGYRGRLRVRVLCYVPDSLRLILGPPGQGKTLGGVPCAGAVHQITTQLRLPPHGDRAVVGVEAGPMTAHRVMMGTAP